MRPEDEFLTAVNETFKGGRTDGLTAKEAAERLARNFRRQFRRAWRRGVFAGLGLGSTLTWLLLTW